MKRLKIYFRQRLPVYLKRLRRLARRAAIAAVVLGAGFWLATWFVRLPEELVRPPDDTLVLVDRTDREIAVVANKRARFAESATLEEMGPWLPKLTVALEDHRFWRHGGIDFIAVFSAARRDIIAGRLISGGSTIAQQLIKTTHGRTGWPVYDKLYEAAAAVRLTREWSRERILEEYLNRIDYGNRRIGLKAAARTYFSKELKDLTLAEAVYLAGLPQAPTRFNPWLKPASAERRYKRALAELARQGVIDAKTFAVLGAGGPPVERKALPNEAPHFVDAVVERTPGLHGRVVTTLDLTLQRQVSRLVSEHVARLRGRGVGQAAVVVLDNSDGSVLAMAGSADYRMPAGQINGTLLPRSCGSVLKPFLYLEAIERRLLTAATVLPDTPDVIRATYIDYDPKNFDERYLGPVRVREALGNSLNVPAVYVLSQVGARTFFERLQEWGFVFPRGLDAYGAGLILGNAEVRLVDLAAAFAGIASGGKVPAWRLLASEARTGRIVATPAASAIIVDVLSDDEARRRAFGRGSPLALPVRAPCKTGTSSGFRDAWTVGSTVRHTVAVWAGNFDGRPMDSTSSIEAAAPLWRATIDILLAGDDGCPTPDGIEGLASADVCRLTGRIPTKESPGVVKEWFLRGTEPTETAAVWLKPGTERARLVLPREYAAWCASVHNYLGAEVPELEELVIRNPTEGGVYVVDGDIPREQQQLVLDAQGPRGAEVAWKIDDQPIGRTKEAFLWALEPGEHEALALSGATSARVRFSVRHGVGR
jgi:penicillin-binding protein 1C